MTMFCALRDVAVFVCRLRTQKYPHVKYKRSVARANLYCFQSIALTFNGDSKELRKLQTQLSSAFHCTEGNSWRIEVIDSGTLREQSLLLQRHLLQLLKTSDNKKGVAALVRAPLRTSQPHTRAPCHPDMAGVYMRRKMTQIALINLALAFAVANASGSHTSTSKPTSCRLKVGITLQPKQIYRNSDQCYGEWCDPATVKPVRIK
ncbi:hypothetical protein V5799_027754 [Amblyomma americanum]|uniref:Uncharacterized protein n=1 Tax=Amblyomma americanum TaxID=6943 RepID=A0AAQ4DET9_AMBAM